VNPPKLTVISSPVEIVASATMGVGAAGSAWTVARAGGGTVVVVAGTVVVVAGTVVVVARTVVVVAGAVVAGAVVVGAVVAGIVVVVVVTGTIVVVVDDVVVVVVVEDVVVVVVVDVVVVVVVVAGTVVVVSGALESVIWNDHVSLLPGDIPQPELPLPIPMHSAPVHARSLMKVSPGPFGDVRWVQVVPSHRPMYEVVGWS